MHHAYTYYVALCTTSERCGLRVIFMNGLYYNHYFYTSILKA